jgi:mannose-1-phosphate guanylyltransferase
MRFADRASFQAYSPRMPSALILAAGFGTRLRPLTLELPKPVVPVGDRPLLAHVAESCRSAGASRLVANVHHEQAKIAKVVEELSLNIQLVVEPEIRGTAGGAAGARPYFEPGEPVLIYNGDILAELGDEARALVQMAGVRDAQVLLVSERLGTEGSVGLDDDGCVVRLRGQRFGRETRSADYIGIMALGPSIVKELPARGCLFGELGLPHLAQGRKLHTVRHRGAWSDLGDLTAYVAANFTWLEQRRKTGRAAGLVGSSWVGEDVAVPGSTSLERCLLGTGVCVTGTGLLREVIAWPGATLAAPLSRAVVLGSGRVVPFDSFAEN